MAAGPQGARPGPGADRRRRRTSSSCRAWSPGIEVAGTLVYAKDGNIWIQSGDQATQLTAPGKGVDDSMPSFSPDGKFVYFVRTRRATGKWSIDGAIKDYALDVPTLMRVTVADGSTDRLLDGIVDPARRLQVERVHPRAGGLARRPLRRDGDRPARPHQAAT